VGQKRKNLLIVGPLPEPKGGVSIHIVRLTNLIQSHFNVRHIDESPDFKSGIFNLRSGNIFGYLRLLLWADIVHIHSGVTLLRLTHILAAALLFRKIIVTIHAFPHQKGHQTRINSLFLRLPNKVIVVNDEIPKLLYLHNFHIKPAFIPPNLASEPDLPANVSGWISSRKKADNTILAANAFRIDFYNGNDLYGIDLCIQSLRELVHNYNRKVSLIFVLSSLSKSKKYFNEYKALISKYALTDHIMLIQADLSFVKLVEITDMVLRPTCTDGDALTVREALFLGKPVIASDVVARPEGTMLFRNRDYKDMSSKILGVLDGQIQIHSHTFTPINYKDYYINLYLN